MNSFSLVEGHPVRIVTLFDYDVHDQATLEIEQRLAAGLPGDAKIIHSPEQGFAWIPLAFKLATCSLVNKSEVPPNTVWVGNAAPRDPRCPNSEGVPFVVAPLPHGQWYLGTANVLAIVKPTLAARSIRFLDVPRNGTQFRSKFLAGAVTRFIDGDESAVQETVPGNTIPKVPKGVIGYRDNFGNLKLVLQQRDPFFTGHKVGDKVLVRVGSKDATARFGENIFDGDAGTLVLAPGSTSHDFPRSKKSPHYMELCEPSGSASRHLGNAKAGDEVTLEWIE